MPLGLRSRLRALNRRRPAQPEAPRTNLEENRHYWDAYAREWTSRFLGYESQTRSDAPSTYDYLGDEWGSPEHLNVILDEFVFPRISARATVLEIGSGGGRLAARVAPRVKHLYCLDISSEMLKRLSAVLADHDNISYVHTEDGTFPPSLLAAELDFVYSFDVFVHIDLHAMWKYVRQIAQSLRPGGAAFLHTANLLTQEGWNRFAKQDRFTMVGHYFITPEVLKTLGARAGLHVEREASEDPSNFYKARDYLVVLRKPI